MQEYSRACLIAFESLPKDTDREGWGRPGTSLRLPTNSGRKSWGSNLTHPFALAQNQTGARWDGVCFRRFLLDTVPDLGPSLKQHIPVLSQMDVRF
jgi:hypothetical protein